MSTATLGTSYSPPSPLELHYSENASSSYPDRPIRPLPKRRLRSRLSSEVADSILYPQAGTSSKPLFQFPYTESEKETSGDASQKYSSENDVGLRQRPQHHDENEKDSYQFKGNELRSEDDANLGIVRRYQEQRQKFAPTNTIPSRIGYAVPRNDASKYMKPTIPPSASSGDSVDGYDSFENTNNKKKRKIPISGSLNSHHSSLSADMAHMDISSTRDIDISQMDSDGSVGQYYGTGSSAASASPHGKGISGAGRGRYGRAGVRRLSGRSPLGVSFNGSNTLQAGRALYSRKDSVASDNVDGIEAGSTTKSSDQGIISAAIANAAAISATPTKGQENVSLLSSKKPSSAKTQFTFTCESDSAKSMMWPGYGYPTPNVSHQEAHPTRVGAAAHRNKGFATQGTQTSPNMPGHGDHTASQQAGVNQKPPQQPKKPRRPLRKQIAIAARERRLQQEYNNYYHPPKEEDVWVCEFCEYESIFGTPPQALMRQYEIKDRRERRHLAEKQRLLEKAKMKGRKGKKGNKNAKNANAATQAQQQNQKQRYDPQAMDQTVMQNQGTQSEEYVLDDYDDDPIPMPNLAPQTPSKIPQPVVQNQNHSLRPPSGSGGNRISSSAGRAA